MVINFQLLVGHVSFFGGFSWREKSPVGIVHHLGGDLIIRNWHGPDVFRCNMFPKKKAYIVLFRKHWNKNCSALWFYHLETIFELVVEPTHLKNITISNLDHLLTSWINRTIPSRKLTYPTWGKGKSSTQNGLFRGYVSSQEGIWNHHLIVIHQH